MASIDGRQLSFYAYVGGNPIRYRDPSGRLFPEAFIGAGLGVAFGLISGANSGDSGSQLLEDAISGGSAGFLIGLTDGLSLAAGAAGMDAAAKVGLSAGIGAGSEAMRQLSNYGCITSGWDIATAGAFGAFGQMTGGSVARAAGDADSALEGAASYTATGVSGFAAGSGQSALSSYESSFPQNCKCKK